MNSDLGSAQQPLTRLPALTHLQFRGQPTCGKPSSLPGVLRHGIPANYCVPRYPCPQLLWRQGRLNFNAYLLAYLRIDHCLLNTVFECVMFEPVPPRLVQIKPSRRVSSGRRFSRQVSRCRLDSTSPNSSRMSRIVAYLVLA